MVIEKMGKQAILIIAHNNIEILKKSLELLDSKYFDFFLHIDKKSNIEYKDIKNCVKQSKIYFYKEIDIRWAHYSQMKCELFLIKNVLESQEKYEYLHLISGVDFPIKKAEEIYNFFHNNYGKEFVHFQNKELQQKKYEWVRYYRFMKNYRNNKPIQKLEKIILSIQKVLKVNRLKKYKYKFMTGANWFSITDSFAKYLINKEKELSKIFKYTRSSDEMFLQTVLYNSKYKSKLYNKNYNNDYDSCKRLIDWDRGNPYIWKKEDKNIIDNSSCFFARKFDYETDKEIIEYLYSKLKKKG